MNMTRCYGRIKVLKLDEDNWLNSVVVCPRCGKHVTFGTMSMYNGVHTCPSCHEGARAEIERDRANDYDLYVAKANDGRYEPFALRKEENK